MKNKITYNNIIAYLQGNIRYFLYYNRYLSFLIPTHIHEQIDFRINSMDRQCYMQGSCTMCGCMTTHLQMANKACDRPCYPKMVGKRTWNFWKLRPTHYIDVESNHRFWSIDLTNKRFI